MISDLVWTHIDVQSSRFPGQPRHFAGFSDALEEIVDARVWGGIHFRNADEQGALLGKKIARWSERHYQRTVTGSSWAALGTSAPQDDRCLLAEHADQDPARDDEERPQDETAPDPLGAPQKDGREPDAPERLGRDERRHDAEAAAEERLVQRDVRKRRTSVRPAGSTETTARRSRARLTISARGS